MWITSAHLWTDVDNRWITAIFADIAWFLRDAQKGTETGNGRHGEETLRIGTVSIVDRFAVCSETALF